MASDAQAVMLAHKWTDKVDPTNWWMSEKLDGVRAYWSGSKFYSRQGNQFIAPAWFTKDLPKEPLDGELWCGRGLFSKTISIIKKTKDAAKHANDWKLVTYLVFDAPGRSAAGDKYEARVKWLEQNIQSQRESTFAAVVGVCKCTGLPHLQKMLKQVLMKGGEGIMLRQPGSLYENNRSHTLLKVKFFHSEEAKVTGHENGSGRCQHMMGKIHCVLPNGVTFKIGSGFSDAQRKKPPKIGSVVEFKFQELSDHGNPRFPVFLRERADLTWADVLTAAKTKTPFSAIKMKKAIPQIQKQHSILFSTIPSRDQESGKKVVTNNDADDDVEEEADNLLTTAAMPPPAAAAAAGKKRAAAPAKRMCQWGAKCYRKNKDHQDEFDHPPREDEDAAAADEDEDPSDPAYEEEKPKRKRARNDDSPSAASPPAAAAAASSPPAAAAAATPASKTACYYGTSCYNRDPDHLRRYSHPDKVEPKTEAEFIETTNQSQHDLAEYYQFGGDPEEDEADAFLAEDKNERRLSIQRFRDTAGIIADEDDDDDAGDVHTVVMTKKTSYFEACASDEDDDDTDRKTMLLADLPPPKPRVKSGSVARVSSNAATVVVQTAAAASSPPAAASPPVSSPSAATTAGASKPCVFIIPELLSKSALTTDSDSGDLICKRCKQDVAEHREAR